MHLPRPDLPMNLKSLNRATLFLNVVVLFLNSAELFFIVPSVDGHLRSIRDGDWIQSDDLKAGLMLEFDGRCLSRCLAPARGRSGKFRKIDH